MGQMGQMMQMPMQMAQQAAQVPSQMMGALGQIPQTVLQGVQGIVEAAKQGADKPGEDSADKDKHAGDQKKDPAAAPKADGTQAGQSRLAEHPPTAQHPPQAAAATLGSGAERAPVTPSAPRHARPESSPEISL
jgi:hypothetical protein